ncbi:uncharacterized protein LOC132063896 [Lycium ferocissimum]|uniref:uncharacterized protein LOC132063896 n=1 Tax=Lycium ferocissimum TaxID=112874 RepID=UPI002815F64E|nr:uncharacterized protein LOC132063896 [Lycium ferocissimum]
MYMSINFSTNQIDKVPREVWPWDVWNIRQPLLSHGNKESWNYGNLKTDNSIGGLNIPSPYQTNWLAVIDRAGAVLASFQQYTTATRLKLYYANPQLMSLTMQTPNDVVMQRFKRL